VWTARCIGDHFLDYFNGPAGDDEGIVLKDPMGILRDCSARLKSRISQDYPPFTANGIQLLEVKITVVTQ
jgi:hypothetical protein